MWKAALHCADGWRGGSSGLQTAGPQRINRIKQRFPRGSNQYEGRSFCGFLQTFRRHIMTKQSQHICRTLDHIASGSINTRHPGITQKLIILRGDDAARDNLDIRPSIIAQQIDERSEEHTSELQSLMRISYAVFCLKKKKQHKNTHDT